MSANFWARLNGDGASLRRFSGAAWSVVGRRRPILDWRTLMVDLRHVVRSVTATECYFGCWPSLSAGEQRKWPRRGGQHKTCAHGRSGPHIASCDAPTFSRDASHLSWLVVCSPGVRRRWRTVRGSGKVARGSFEPRSTRADDAMDSGRTITRINDDRNSIPIATVTNSWVH